MLLQHLYDIFQIFSQSSGEKEFFFLLSFLNMYKKKEEEEYKSTVFKSILSSKTVSKNPFNFLNFSLFLKNVFFFFFYQPNRKKFITNLSMAIIKREKCHIFFYSFSICCKYVYWIGFFFNFVFFLFLSKINL